MSEDVKQTLDGMSADDIRRLLRALDTAIEELGAHLPIRQVMALLLIALADKAGRPIGVSDIDKQLGDLKSGSASKLLRTMMHVEADKKADVANTVYAERDKKDLRRWDLHLTTKGVGAVESIIKAMEGKR